ncbi:MAG: glycosyltransferase family 2 protein [Acetobacteraceae bacterium]|nr:glycosyltransferase family 2 protein [Acetobacteraceae bacterium]
MRVAALTMSYNEPVWARIWARHYSRQVGETHCFLLDHGSDDGSADGLTVNVERLARTALDEDERAASVSARAAELLQHYDAVVHTDVDELVVADPRRYKDLRAFAAAVPGPVMTTVGLDVQHIVGEEAILDPERPIGTQRRWVRFSAAMCKPAFVRRHVQWTPGFHTCDFPAQFGGLYLFHLRYSDLALGLQRLRRTRGQQFSTPETNLHQRVSDQNFQTMVEAIAQLPRETVPFDTRDGPIAEAMRAVVRAQEGGAEWLSMAGHQLWALPRPFAAEI